MLISLSYKPNIQKKNMRYSHEEDSSMCLLFEEYYGFVESNVTKLPGLFDAFKISKDGKCGKSSKRWSTFKIALCIVYDGSFSKVVFWSGSQLEVIRERRQLFIKLSQWLGMFEMECAIINNGYLSGCVCIQLNVCPSNKQRAKDG